MNIKKKKGLKSQKVRQKVVIRCFFQIISKTQQKRKGKSSVVTEDFSLQQFMERSDLQPYWASLTGQGRKLIVNAIQTEQTCIVRHIGIKEGSAIYSLWAQPPVVVNSFTGTQLYPFVYIVYYGCFRMTELNNYASKQKSKLSGRIGFV